MKHKLLQSLMLIAVLLTSTHAHAYDFTSDGIYYTIKSSTYNTIEVTYRYINYGSYSGDITIPETIIYNDILYRVTCIGSNAFSGCDELTSVTIPNSVTSIGSEAFEGCSGLTSITIPNSATSIGERAFSGCSGLTSITIPNSVISIGKFAFDGCTGLTNVTIGNSVTSIGFCAFRGCSGLTCLTIPNSVTSIDKMAFRGCSSLTSISIPNSVTGIGSNAFYGCTGLCSIKRNATATTQTKLNFDITNNTEYEFYIELNYKTYGSKDKTIQIPELAPGICHKFSYGLIINKINCFIDYISEYTKSLDEYLQIETGIISINAKGSYTEGDATILGTGLGIGSAVSEYDN